MEAARLPPEDRSERLHVEPERLRAETDALLARREEMSAAATAIAKPDAARDIAAEVLAATRE